MRAVVRRISEWKRANMTPESTMHCGVNARFQQYLDTILLDLGQSPWRKLPNVLAEVADRYSPEDYKGVHAALRKRLAEHETAPLRVLSVDM